MQLDGKVAIVYGAAGPMGGAAAAVSVASDRAGATTGTVLDLSCGAIVN